jgi:hypothetical protein
VYDSTLSRLARRQFDSGGQVRKSNNIDTVFVLASRVIFTSFLVAFVGKIARFTLKNSSRRASSKTSSDLRKPPDGIGRPVETMSE